MADVTVSQEIGAPADRVFEMVSDLTRMHEWSPENEGVTWRGGATEPKIGARFHGTNRYGRRKWSTAGQITEFDPGRAFAFRITAIGMPIAEWRYEFQPTAVGCEVTEAWTDQRGRVAKALGKPVSGVTDRADHNRSTMEQTLRNLKSAAEEP